MRRVNRERGLAYKRWANMRQRCTNPGDPYFADYGGRGIKVCERWASFELFVEDVGLCPGRRWSLDRVDNNGDYEPGNCRWATTTEQARNSRNTKLDAEKVRAIRALFAAGTVYREIAEQFGISMSLTQKVVCRERWADVD